MSEITVKLKDPTRIAWDNQGPGTVISGPEAVTVEETHFIRAKINEGALVEVKPEEGSLPVDETIIKELKKHTVPDLQLVAEALELEYDGLTKDPLTHMLAGQEDILEKVNQVLVGD